MEKDSAKNKIHKNILIAIFAVIFSFSLLLNNTEAAPALNWENPNKTGKMDPYKFKITDILSSDLMMKVVGCTGIVDKISVAMTEFAASIFDSAYKATIAQAKANIVTAICVEVNNAAQKTAAPIDGAMGGGNLTPALKDILKCDTIDTTQPNIEEKAKRYDEAQKVDAQRRMEQCFNGIAFTLAKNQLTAMARYAINWVNTGFGGDPFYVRNVQNLLYNVEHEILKNSLNSLMTTDGAFPYSRSFTKSLIRYNKVTSSGLNALNDLASDLADFVTDPKTYLGDEKISKLEKSQRAVQLFVDDFHNGGWDAYLAFTQRDTNNPIGYTMLASEIIATQQEEKVTQVKEELLQNNGFLSQKKCVRYANKPSTETNNIPVPIRPTPPMCDDLKSDTCKNQQSFYDRQMVAYEKEMAIVRNYNANVKITTSVDTNNCVEWEVVTPGSLIKDKISNYLTSPDRQAELADSINDVLNSVFSNLLSRLADQGLSSLSSGGFSYSDVDMLSAEYSNKPSPTSNLSGQRNNYRDGSFNLTRDLGNRYNYDHNRDSRLGTWDAGKNIATRKDGTIEKLINGIGPVVVGPEKTISYPINVYYEVVASGKTALFDNGHSGWAVGDKAFWDGENWQNWKADKSNPIYRRGVLQLQKDYVVAVKELLQNLPAVMPKIGELDYCLPGPNINWDRNYGEAVNAFSEYAYSLSSEYRPGKFFIRDTSTFSIAGPGEEVYENYKNIFTGADSLWNQVRQTQTWVGLNKLASYGLQKRDRVEDNLTDLINAELNLVNKNLKIFREQYGEFINNIYGPNGLIQTQSYEKETSEQVEPNPAYLAVAEVAYPITKEIVQYNENIEEMTTAYKEQITLANSNIYKLETIKGQVSQIIVEAQKRRNENMLKIIKEEAERTGGKVLTALEFKNKYAQCLEEENIIFYEDLDIMKNTTSEEERCNDGLDNDLDGLIDEQDPDCFGFSGNPTRGSGTTTGGTTNGPGTAFGGGGDDAFGSNNSGNQGGDNNAFVR